MRLKDITTAISFFRVLLDRELVIDIQNCLQIPPTGIFGPETNKGLVELCHEWHLNSWETQFLSPELAQALLARRGNATI